MLYSSYKRSVRRKGTRKIHGLPFDISYEDFVRLAKSNCHYCGAPPAPRVFRGNPGRKRERREVSLVHGLDRLNSEVGYITSNVVTCCTTCNRMKLDHSTETFIKHINKIHEHMRSKDEI